ncbi:MAG TPA: hypothetical protein VLM81_04490 [Peptostreptococcaceae bacterium]|nr:hypothetical protein [Peptostreptococcaceae bacterium]
MENKYIYEKIDKVLQVQDKVNYEELLELFNMLKLNIQTTQTNINNNKIDENSFYNYIQPSYYVQKLETIYSSFAIAPSRNEDER